MITSTPMKVKSTTVSSSVVDRANLWSGSTVAPRVAVIARTRRVALVITALEVSVISLHINAGISDLTYTRLKRNFKKHHSPAKKLCTCHVRECILLFFSATLLATLICNISLGNLAKYNIDCPLRVLIPEPRELIRYTPSGTRSGGRLS